MRKSWAVEPDCLGLNPGSATCQLYDLNKLVKCLCLRFLIYKVGTMVWCSPNNRAFPGHKARLRFPASS